MPNGEVHHVTVGKDGKFSFDIRGFDLKKDDTLKLHFIKDDMMVERDIVVTNEKAENGGTSGSNNSNNKKPGYLPQTGEEATPFALARVGHCRWRINDRNGSQEKRSKIVLTI